MADNIDDGGAAFPVVLPNNYEFGHDGMSLRDWFAGQALANPRTHAMANSNTTEDIAMWAYGVADAMLAERNR